MTMFQLRQVFVFVVSLPVLPEPPEDFEPALAQTAQRAGMTVALGTLVLVVSGRPVAGQPAAVGPQMDRGPQPFVAGPAQAALRDLAALIADRADARLTHQRVGVGIFLAYAPDFAQEPRAQRGFG